MAEQEIIIELPQRGSYTWPGREQIDARTRVLLESRTLEELIDASNAIDVENLESVLGFWEYLRADWRWLHDPKFRKKYPGYVSTHSMKLRAGGHYLRSTRWRGGIPNTDAVSDYLNLLNN